MFVVGTYYVSVERFPIPVVNSNPYRIPVRVYPTRAQSTFSINVRESTILYDYFTDVRIGTRFVTIFYVCSVGLFYKLEQSLYVVYFVLCPFRSSSDKFHLN